MPNPDIKLKGWSGKPFEYKNVPKILLADPSWEPEENGEDEEQIPPLIPYTYGEAKSMTVAPDFSGGDMAVPIPEGELVNDLTIKKPGTLVPEHIKQGVTVAGVKGEFLGDAEERTVALSMANGDQVVTPSAEGKVISKLTIQKPNTMAPENIKSGVEIGGVRGTFVGDSEEITVELDMANGNQVILPVSEGKALSKVTVQKPEELVPENIAEGVVIAGVGPGTHKGGSGGGGGENMEHLIVGKTISGAYSNDLVTNVGTSVFMGCSKLTAVSFPNCETVNAYAFANCSQLSEVYLYNGVPDTAMGPMGIPIASSAFYMCSSLRGVYCELENGEISHATIKLMEGYNFASCYKLSSVNLHNHCYYGITPYAFYMCSSLASLGSYVDTVGLSANYIDPYAFYNCSNLPKISLFWSTNASTSTFRISSYAFYGCSRLSQLYINFSASNSATIMALGTSAFSNTPFLNSAYLGRYGSIYVYPSSRMAWFKSKWPAVSARISWYTP